MSSEITNLRGRLAHAEKLQHALQVGIDCDIDEIRSMADKYEPKVELKSDRIVVVADRLHNQVVQLRKMTDQIRSIKKDLGEE